MSGFLDGLRAAAAAALFPADGELKVAGLSAPVTVHRDRWGIPAIRAASIEDLWFAQGLVSAGERLFQIDLAIRAANGRLSELFAERTLDADRFALTVGFRRAAERYLATYDDESGAMTSRFVQGVLAWVERMPAPPVEYALLDVTPEIPSDLTSWAACAGYLAWGLSGNADEELLRTEIAETMGPEWVGRLMPPLSGDPAWLAAGGFAGKLQDELPPRPTGQGSNGWTVSGRWTASGKPLLANDPHLIVQQPSAWIEMHLAAPGYVARGVALPFAPGIIVGATPHHAWGFTNVTGDVQDLYVEHLSEDGTAAEFDGAWEPLRVHREEIRVRGSSEPVVHEVPETRHGPLLDVAVVGLVDPEYVPLGRTVALRWTGHDASIPPSVFARLARATSFAGFRDALRDLGCPGQNVMYADVEGTIGYQCTGRYPLRRKGDGTVPVPGWTSEHEWDGWLDFDDLPWSENPERGYVVTANNRIHDDSYPHLIGRDFHSPNRAIRIVDRIAQLGDHDVASFASIQADTVSLAARAVLPRLLELVDVTDPRREALEALSDWDGDMAAGSRAAALFNAWVAEIGRALLPDEALRRHYLTWRERFLCEALPALALDPEDVGRALDAAVAATGERTWGEMHEVRFAHPLGRMPGLEPLFVAAESPLGGDEQTVAQGGFDGRDGFTPAVVPSWRAVWDLADLDRSTAVLTTGVSGNPASPHWSDQAPLWAAGDQREAPVTREAVDALAVSTLSLVPG